MINLIPPSARKAVFTEYWIRVMSMWMLLVGIACLVVAIFQSPAFLLVSLKLKASLDVVAEAKVQEEQFLAGQRAIENAHQLSALLLRTEETTSFVTITDKLNELSGPSIRLDGIDIIRGEDDMIETLDAMGVADTRAALNEYRNRIEADELFSEVFLPLSNLAKQEDILFKISISLNGDGVDGEDMEE